MSSKENLDEIYEKTLKEKQQKKDQIVEKGKINIILLFYNFFNSASFDKYENYELEKEFSNQINQRVMFVSKEINGEYKEDRSFPIAQLEDDKNFFQMEMSFIFYKNEEVNPNQDTIQDMSESALNSIISRSRLIRQTKSIR